MFLECGLLVDIVEEASGSYITGGFLKLRMGEAWPHRYGTSASMGICLRWQYFISCKRNRSALMHPGMHARKPVVTLFEKSAHVEIC